jgi:hypothetical protein
MAHDIQQTSSPSEALHQDFLMTVSRLFICCPGSPVTPRSPFGGVPFPAASRSGDALRSDTDANRTSILHLPDYDTTHALQRQGLHLAKTANLTAVFTNFSD